MHIDTMDTVAGIRRREPDIGEKRIHNVIRANGVTALRRQSHIDAVAGVDRMKLR